MNCLRVIWLPLLLSCALPSPAAAAECACKLRWVNAGNSPLTVTVASQAPQKLPPKAAAEWCRKAGDSADRTVGYVAAADGWQLAGTATCTTGETRTVSLQAPGGSVLVRNRTPEPQGISIDGGPPVLAQPGAEKLFGPLPAGLHRVVSRSRRSAWAWGRAVQVGAGGQVAVNLPRPSGTLKLHNPLAEPAQVLVDGAPFGLVAADAEIWLAGMGPGAHPVRWQGDTTGKFSEELYVADDPTARLSGLIRLRAINRTGEDLQLPAELANLGGKLKAKAQADWLLQRGDYRLHATGADSGLDYVFDVRKRSQADQKWTIARPTALLRVRNLAGEAAKISVHGADVAVLPHNSKALLRVPAGRLQLAARVASRAEPQRAGIFLRGHEQAQWTVAARETCAIVVNRWPEPLELRVDGRRAATLAAGGDIRVPLRPGKHTLQLRQWRTGWLETAELVLRDGDKQRAEFAPPSANVVLDNRHGSEPAGLWIDGQGKGAAAGKTAAMTTPAGTVHARTENADGSRERLIEAAVLPTQQFKALPPPRQTVDLFVVAAADRGAQVQVDDGPPRRLAAGEKWPVGPVSASDHVLTVQDNGRTVRALVRVDGNRGQLVVQLRRGGK